MLKKVDGVYSEVCSFLESTGFHEKERFIFIRERKDQHCVDTIKLNLEFLLSTEFVEADFNIECSFTFTQAQDLYERIFVDDKPDYSFHQYPHTSGGNAAYFSREYDDLLLSERKPFKVAPEGDFEPFAALIKRDLEKYVLTIFEQNATAQMHLETNRSKKDLNKYGSDSYAGMLCRLKRAALVHQAQGKDEAIDYFSQYDAGKNTKEKKAELIDRINQLW